MADEVLDPFPGTKRFYDYRGPAGSVDGPPIWLPIHQGDVFAGLTVPGVPPDDGDAMAMVFMHPCVLRKPSTEYVTVFRVTLKTAKDRPYERFADNYSVMPLVDLFASGQGGVHVAELTMVGVVSQADLSRSNRIASLSQDGRLLLQQRVIHHFTRHAPPLHDLRNITTRVERELSLLSDWCESACERHDETADTVAAAEKSFDAFMNDTDRRARLADDTEAHNVIAEVNREVARLDRL